MINVKKEIKRQIKNAIYRWGFVRKLARYLYYYHWKLNVFLGRWKFSLHLETTSFCNAKCVFCPNPYLKRAKNTMTEDMFKKVLDEVKKARIKVKAFILHLNGEPLMDKNIMNRIEEIKKTFPDSEVGFTTNFSLANYQTIENLLASNLDEITISLNSLDPEEYKNIMGIVDFEKTMENINTLIELKEKNNSSLKVNISIVQRQDNQDQVEKFNKQWKDKCNIRIIHLGQWVGKELPENYSSDSDAVLCTGLYKTINILSNCDYSLCCFDSEGIIAKNILSVPIREAFFSGEYERIRKYHRKYGIKNKECVNCSFNR